jgi:hypothetical protein
VIGAGAALAAVLVEPAVGAVEGGAEGEELVEGVEGLVDGAGAGVWSEVASAVLLDAAHVGHTGPLLLHGDLDVGVGFIVFEQDVVLGAVLLDQVHLEQQSLQFALCDDNVKVGDTADEAASFVAEAAGGAEIGAHAVPQTLALADVEQLALGVLPEVDAGGFGDALEALLEGCGVGDGGVGEIRHRNAEYRM